MKHVIITPFILYKNNHKRKEDRCQEMEMGNLYRRKYMRIPQYTDIIPTIMTVHICTAVVNNVKMNSIGIIELFLWFLFISIYLL